MTDEVYSGLVGADTVLIEANHDENMLMSGPYPAALKRRILSDHGHLSNENCARLAVKLSSRGTGKIILGHLSRENNDPLVAEACVRSILGDRAELYMAPVLGDLEVTVSGEAESQAV